MPRLGRSLALAGLAVGGTMLPSTAWAQVEAADLEPFPDTVDVTVPSGVSPDASEELEVGGEVTPAWPASDQPRPGYRPSEVPMGPPPLPSERPRLFPPGWETPSSGQMPGGEADDRPMTSDGQEPGDETSPRPGRTPNAVPMPPLPPSQRPRMLQTNPAASPDRGLPSNIPDDPAEQIAPAVIELSPTSRP
ncbi:MAG: hypothetical protein AAFW95_14885, partial [Cyanobacteria bacterium J06638_6]